MKFKLALVLPAALLSLSACQETAEPDAETTASGAEAGGEVLGGTIDDEMLPLHALTSTSPSAEQTPSDGDTVTTQTVRSDGGQTTVETSTQTVTQTGSTGDGPNQPEPPETPAAPE